MQNLGDGEYRPVRRFPRFFHIRRLGRRRHRAKRLPRSVVSPSCQRQIAFGIGWSDRDEPTEGGVQRIHLRRRSPNRAPASVVFQTPPAQAVFNTRLVLVDRRPLLALYTPMWTDAAPRRPVPLSAITAARHQNVRTCADTSIPIPTIALHCVVTAESPSRSEFAADIVAILHATVPQPQRDRRASGFLLAIWPCHARINFYPG